MILRDCDTVTLVDAALDQNEAQVPVRYVCYAHQIPKTFPSLTIKNPVPQSNAKNPVAHVTGSIMSHPADVKNVHLTIAAQ